MYQVVGRNVSILMRSVYVDKTNGQHHAIETVYQPCSKDRKESFLTKDGPLFKLKDGVTRYPDSPLVLGSLQELRSTLSQTFSQRLILIIYCQCSVCTMSVVYPCQYCQSHISISPHSAVTGSHLLSTPGTVPPLRCRAADIHDTWQYFCNARVVSKW